MTQGPLFTRHKAGVKSQIGGRVCNADSYWYKLFWRLLNFILPQPFVCSRDFHCWTILKRIVGTASGGTTAQSPYSRHNLLIQMFFNIYIFLPSWTPLKMLLLIFSHYFSPFCYHTIPSSQFLSILHLALLTFTIAWCSWCGFFMLFVFILFIDLFCVCLFFCYCFISLLFTLYFYRFVLDLPYLSVNCAE